MDFDISYSSEFDGAAPAIVLNCGPPAALPNGEVLGNFQSGVFEAFKIRGERLVVIPVSRLEVTDEIAQYIRTHWKSVYELFGDEQLRSADFYGLPGIKRGDFTFSFWYSGENLSGTIHREHDFYELHTQILGKGAMEKFAEADERTLYESISMAPGQTHRPFFAKGRAPPAYPWHRYLSITKSLLLGIESPYPIPVSL